MDKLNRRSFLKTRAGFAVPALPAGATADAGAEEGTSRRAFLQGTAGAAAGAAAILAAPKVAAIALGLLARQRTSGRCHQGLRTRTGRAGDRVCPRRRARRGDGHVRQAGDHLQGPRAREAAARRGPLTSGSSNTRPRKATDMSSHREAPEISKDPVADNTDTYAFVSPDNPETVTIITNYLPAEVPAGGPTFFEFGNDVLYTIHIDNDGDGLRRHHLRVQLRIDVHKPQHLPLQHGTDQLAERPQLEQTPVLQRHAGRSRKHGKARQGCSAKASRVPPCNIGPRSTPNYAALGKEAVHSLPGNQTVFAGQRNDPFFVDIGSIFDLADLRPFQEAAPDSDARRARRGHAADAQRPHDRDPGPDHEPHGRRLRADQRHELEGRARRVGLGQPPQGSHLRRRQQRTLGGRSLGAGLAARQPRCSTRCSSR